jgi:membrane associated rhomboid family serine protease
VLAIVVPVSVVALILPQDDLLMRLAKDNDAIRAGEWWRLLTVGLVHGGPLHLAVNAMFLYDLGRIVEQLFGPRRMLLVLWGGVATGALASYLTHPAPSVGISGGLFALVGAMLAQGIRYWRRLAPAGRRLFLRGPVEIVILNAGLGLVLPYIDNAGHLGGLAGGLLLGGLRGFPPLVEARLTAPTAPPPSPGSPSPGG